MLKSTNEGFSIVTALKACDESYKLILKSFRSALAEVKDDKDYESCSYDISSVLTVEI